MSGKEAVVTTDANPHGLQPLGPPARRGPDHAPLRGPGASAQAASAALMSPSEIPKR